MKTTKICFSEETQAIAARDAGLLAADTQVLKPNQDLPTAEAGLAEDTQPMVTENKDLFEDETQKIGTGVKIDETRRESAKDDNQKKNGFEEQKDEVDGSSDLNTSNVSEDLLAGCDAVEGSLTMNDSDKVVQNNPSVDEEDEEYVEHYDCATQLLNFSGGSEQLDQDESSNDMIASSQNETRADRTNYIPKSMVFTRLSQADTVIQSPETCESQSSNELISTPRSRVFMDEDEDSEQYLASTQDLIIGSDEEDEDTFVASKEPGSSPPAVLVDDEVAPDVKSETNTKTLPLSQPSSSKKAHKKVEKNFEKMEQILDRKLEEDDFFDEDDPMETSIEKIKRSDEKKKEDQRSRRSLEKAKLTPMKLEFSTQHSPTKTSDQDVDPKMENEAKLEEERPKAASDVETQLLEIPSPAKTKEVTTKTSPRKKISKI